MNFKTQAESFLKHIQTRRRNPVKPSTVTAYRSRLDSHILPILGHMELAKIENGVLKAFVASMSQLELSASAINGYVSLIKEVVASAVDENGNQLFPRTWNSDFMDLPVISKADQETPVATPQSIQAALGCTNGRERALYALLAGSGLRIGECLSLRFGPDNGSDSYWAPETGVLTIRTTLDIKTGQIMPSPKTEAGNRLVDLHPDLNAFLIGLLCNQSTPAQALVFANRSGNPMRFNSLREHAIELGIDPRFHAFRRFRTTHMDTVGVPQGLQRFWAGHANSDVHEGYIKMKERIEDRKNWAIRAGLGFSLQEAA